MTTSSTEPGFSGTVLLTRRDVADLIDLDDCIEAVAGALRRHAEGRTLPPGVLGVHATDGGFHIKAAGLRDTRTWFAAKCNGNFFHNAERFGLPRIQGLILLCDGDNGRPLAVIDSVEVTLLRTAAATAVAARHLAREDARVAAVIGCGVQGIVQARACARVRPIERILAYDTEPARAVALARDLARHDLPVTVMDTPGAAAAASDIVVTCTPAKRFFLGREDVRPGTFIAGVGADSEEKQELDPRLFLGSKVVVDNLAQCAAIGDLHHAITAGTIAPDGVHAELHDVVADLRPGRTTPSEITIFDSTGIAIEDVAAAVLVYERARARGRGTSIDFLA